MIEDHCLTTDGWKPFHSSKILIYSILFPILSGIVLMLLNLILIKNYSSPIIFILLLLIIPNSLILSHIVYNNFQLKCYMNNLAFYCQLSIQLYHRITQPETRTPEDHLNKFYTEFPESRITLETLMNHIYNDKPLDDQPVELLTKTIDSVLQKILKKIDLLGKNNQEQPPTTLPTTQSPTPYSITSSEQPTNNETASQNQKPTTT